MNADSITFAIRVSPQYDNKRHIDQQSRDVMTTLGAFASPSPRNNDSILLSVAQLVQRKSSENHFGPQKTQESRTEVLKTQN